MYSGNQGKHESAKPRKTGFQGNFTQTIVACAISHHVIVQLPEYTDNGNKTLTE